MISLVKKFFFSMSIFIVHSPTVLNETHRNVYRCILTWVLNSQVCVQVNSYLGFKLTGMCTGVFLPGF
jgi:hypothetical protein